MKRYLLLLSVILLVAAAGCVDINDARVQVHLPGQVDPYGQIALQQCTPHVSPHRLITGQTGSSSPLAEAGNQLVNTQALFDQYWSYVTANVNEKITTNSSGRPLVNWDNEVAYFFVVRVGNSCEKCRPMPDEMTTDCFSISLPIYRYQEGTNCQPASAFSVFIYLFPKTNLPIGAVSFYPTPISTPTPKPTLTPTSTPTPVPPPPSEDE